MPKKYEAIRDRLKAEGVPEKEAKSRAARIYNATRKRGQKPVTGIVEKAMRHRGGKRKRG